MAKPIICIIDDDKDLLEAYKLSLRSLGEIYGFSDPSLYLEHIDKNPDKCPDLIVTDFSMPKMSGLDLLKASQEKKLQFSAILVSGDLDKDRAIALSNTGITIKILEKPVSREILVSSATEMLLGSEVKKIRTEMRKTMGQLREIFSVFRLICVDELELQKIKEPALESNSDEENPLSLDEALEELESRLIALDKDEQDLTERLNLYMSQISRQKN